MLLILLLVPAVMAICPMESHQLCNSGNLECVCSVAQEDESPVPQVSCNTFIQRDEDGNFPAVSVEFTLDDSTDNLESWPEEGFRNKISSSLRVDEEDIIILRASCGGTTNILTVQFVIQKKETNSSAYPFEVEDFIDADSIATRMKAMGHLAKIADLDVDSIDSVDELIDIEFEPSNLKLIFLTIVTTAAFVVFLVMGILKVCKKEEYTDDLQKP